jgi:lysophospholipase L1-like esterase
MTFGWVARTRRMLALVTIVLVAGACTHPNPPGDTHAAGPRYASYVALGDSYTAGPFIATTDLAGGCFRSDHNYPSLLAKQLKVAHFTDVSCSAATTADLTSAQHTLQGAKVPPQLRALRRSTDLVTLGIGGNDAHLFVTLVETCTRLRSTDPTGAPCTTYIRHSRPDLFQAIRRTGVRVARSLEEIRARSPHAEVVLVGYLRLAPAHGTCPGRLPLADGDYVEANRISRALVHALAGAAKSSHATFVNMLAASSGHDVCSRAPWVNGRRSIPDVAFAYHPLEAGMRAVARQVEQALR